MYTTKRESAATIFYTTHSKGRPKVEIPLWAVTESRPKVTYHIRPKPICATESKEGLSAENQNRRSIVSEPTRL